MTDRRTLLSASLIGLALVAACGSDGGTGPTSSGPGSPEATITAPGSGSTYTSGQRISFVGSATDAEDGALSGGALVWTSSRDGTMGSGASLEYNELTVGSHKITLKATDSDSKFGTDTVTVLVDPIPDVPNVPSTQIILKDDIDDENGGVAAKNVATLSNFNVTRECIDLHGPGSTNPLPGNGLYIDMDGTCNQAGRIESKSAYPLAAGTYMLDIVMAGNNQVEKPDTMTVSVGSALSQQVIRQARDPFQLYSFPFTVAAATSATIVFDHQGTDQQGILIDAIQLRKTD